jgi:hypothetical protein
MIAASAGRHGTAINNIVLRSPGISSIDGQIYIIVVHQEQQSNENHQTYPCTRIILCSLSTYYSHNSIASNNFIIIVGREYVYLIYSINDCQ